MMGLSKSPVKTTDSWTCPLCNNELTSKTYWQLNKSSGIDLLTQHEITKHLSDANRLEICNDCHQDKLPPTTTL